MKAAIVKSSALDKLNRMDARFFLGNIKEHDKKIARLKKAVVAAQQRLRRAEQAKAEEAALLGRLKKAGYVKEIQT